MSIRDRASSGRAATMSKPARYIAGSYPMTSLWRQRAKKGRVPWPSCAMCRRQELNLHGPLSPLGPEPAVGPWHLAGINRGVSKKVLVSQSDRRLSHRIHMVSKG